MMNRPMSRYERSRAMNHSKISGSSMLIIMNSNALLKMRSAMKMAIEIQPIFWKWLTHDFVKTLPIVYCWNRRSICQMRAANMAPRMKKAAHKIVVCPEVRLGSSGVS